MNVRIVTLGLGAAGIIVLMSLPIVARAASDSSTLTSNPRANDGVTTTPLLQRPHDRMTTRLTDIAGPRVQSGSLRRSVGAGATGVAASPGMEVDLTYDDWASSTRGRNIDFWGTPDIHFAYTDQPTADLNQFRMGYNVYDPIGGTWPRGLGAGCEVQGPGDVGGMTSMGVTPKGRIVFGGFDGSPADNHIYYQSLAKYSCTWGLGSVIPQAQYSSALANATGDTRMYLPVIETQIVGNDTVVHLIARPSTVVSRPGASIQEFQLQYYRKIGNLPSGTWSGPTVIDTIYAVAHIAASRVSPKIAVSYARTSPAGFLNNQELDEAVYVKMSTDGGLTWPASPTAITSSDRSVESISPWLETQCLFDSQNDLHVVFNAQEVPANPYGSAFDWSSLYNGSNIYHWCSGFNTLSTVYNATWPLDRIQSDLCGWMGYNALTTASVSITECAGHMYTFWSMANDLNSPGVVPNDCASGGEPNDWRFAANAEVFMSISNDLSGLLWDFPRNITQTYTPNCDSATGGGVCLNDTKPMVSRYAMDSSSYGQSLAWPEPSLTPGGYPRTNDSAIQLFYIEDHYPGQWSLSDPLTFVPTLNSLRWVRIACGAPICYPAMGTNPTALGVYPDFYIKPSEIKHRNVEVRNRGCGDGTIAQISVTKQTFASSNWLRVDETSLSLLAGGRDTLHVTIDATTLSYTPGTVYDLLGKIILTNITPDSPIDTAAVEVNYTFADTLVDLTWDTVSTSCTRLVVSSNGDMGRLGLGGYNLDYVGLGTDCSTTPAAADVYLYSGGPMVIRKTGTNSYVFSSALFQADFLTTQAFKNIVGTSPASLNTVDYDGFYTGYMVNRDSSIVLDRTYYAPKSGTCNFIIAKTRYWAKSSAVSDVLISEIADWDVPGLRGSDNRTGISPVGFVYQRGTDTLSTCPDSARYAGLALLGYYNVSQLITDSCINNIIAYGMYAQLNDSVFKYDTTSENVEAGYFWNKAQSSLNATPYSDDHHSALTIRKGMNISPTDTFVTYTIYATVKQGTLGDLEAAVQSGGKWYKETLRSCTGCCVGRVGNIDCDPSDNVDIGDITALIDNLFLTFKPACCKEEFNCDGDPLCSIDIGDLTALIDHLFITFRPLPMCTNNCPE